ARPSGGERLKTPSPPLFDADGNIVAVPILADVLLSDQRPAWAPSWMLERPGTTLMLPLVTTAGMLAIVWMGITLPFLLTLIGTAIPVTACLALDARGA